MHLPDPIKTYFNATSPQDAEALAAAFNFDAVVRDEGDIHCGRDQICGWWKAAQQKYNHRAEPSEINEIAGKTVVRATVTGAFAGSPITLHFTFGLAGNHITDLVIG